MKRQISVCRGECSADLMASVSKGILSFPSNSTNIVSEEAKEIIG